MANFKDKQKSVLLGNTTLENTEHTQENFTTLFTALPAETTRATDAEQDLSDRIDAVQGDFDGLSDEVDTLQDDVTTLQSNVTTLQSTVQGLDSDISDLEADKQDAKPNGTTPLLDSNYKIDTTYIPDSVLGQLEYQGTWDASLEEDQTVRTPEKGDYYICSVDGANLPTGRQQQGLTFEVGDWAICHGYDSTDAIWDKVDNTDAVRMVNGQIGNVETYKGSWSETAYHKGDIVTQNSVLYLCIADATSSQTPSDETHWAKMGKPRENSTSFDTDDWSDLDVDGKTYKAIDLYSTPIRVVKTISSGVDVEADVAYVRISTATTTTLYMISATAFDGSYTLIE